MTKTTPNSELDKILDTAFDEYATVIRDEERHKDHFSEERFVITSKAKQALTQLLLTERSKTVNRIEVIDHTKDGEGRVYVKWVDEPFEVELSEQDDGKTLKIFLKPKEK